MAQASNKGGQKPRHVPERTCIACRRSDAKRQLIRVVREGEGRVAVDLSGRRNGRGAYLCSDQACWEAALKRRGLERALRVDQLHPDDLAALKRFAGSLEIDPMAMLAGERPPTPKRD